MPLPPISGYRRGWAASVGGEKVRLCSGSLRRNPMKRLLFTVVLLLAISGCTTSPAAVPGPPGQQGAQGQAGQQGNQGNQGDPGQSGQQGRQGNPGNQGNQGDQGDQGHRGDQGKNGQQGSNAPCPADQHRYTDPATGEVRCVRD